jgi:uncharacterized protein (DUF58 family)
MSSLLDAEFMRRLEALRRRLSSEARSGGVGEGASRRRGAGAEFQEHRPYAPGDDPRRVDWMATARSGEPVVKLYRAEEDRVVRLLVDGSASLGFGSPPKLATAQRLAAALAYLSLAGSERAQVFLGRGAGTGSGLEAAGSPRRGRKAFAALCRELEAIRAEGTTELARAVEGVLARSARAGMLAVLSDFFDPGQLFTALGHARAAGHDVILIQILDPEEIDPKLDGDYSLEDSETGARVELTADPTALAAYAAQLGILVQNIRDWARRHGAVYVRTQSDADLEQAVRRVMSRTID